MKAFDVPTPEESLRNLKETLKQQMSKREGDQETV
jgi:hypothetical protein